MKTIEQALKEYKFVVHDVVGQSMLPLLKEGTNKVQLIRPTALKLFDVVLYKGRDNKYVLHRIIDINKNDLIIIGDNNQYLEYKKKKDIIAKINGIYEPGNYYDLNSSFYLNYLNNNYPFKNEENRQKLIHDARQFFIDRQKNAYFELIKLEITGSLNNEPFNILTPSEKQRFIKEMKDKKAVPYLSLAIKTFGVNFGKELNKEIIEFADKIFNVNVREDAAINKITEVFSSFNIPHIFLKGSETKKLYRYQDLRTRNDIDVLVSEDNFKEACNILKRELNAEFICDTNHDESFLLPILKVHIELHRSINHELPDDLKHLLQNPFKDAIQVDNTSRYLMTNTKNLLSILTHSAKHCRYGQTWMPMLLDFYYLSKQNVDLSLIKKARLMKFYDTLNHLMNHILHNKELTASETCFINLWFKSPNEYLSALYRGDHQSKFKFYFYRFFMPLDDLKKQFPLLNKYSFLYPYFLIKRLCIILFSKSRRNNVKKELQIYNRANKEESIAIEGIGLKEFSFEKTED